MSDRYPHLFSELEIGNVTVRNRVMQTGHGKAYAVGGKESARHLAYQVERAKGGIGLIVTGIHIIHPSAPLPRTPMGYLRNSIDSDRRLTSAVKDHGASIFAQLGHTGSMFSSDIADDLRVLLAPSPIPMPVTGEMPKEMEAEDIQELVDAWSACAAIAREGGFQGVELHFAHTYLMHQFFSPTFNQRKDEYGGTPEKRRRFAVEVVDAVRDAVGSDFVVGVRLGVSDFLPDGYDVPDAVEVAKALVARGVDYVSCSVGGLEKELEISPSDLPDGHLVHLTARVKEALPDVPVFVVGGVKEPSHAEEIVAGGKADMVAMTRAQIAEPHWARKAQEGREDEIYHCIRGNQGCIGRVQSGRTMGCTVNPAAGRERLFGGELPPAADPGRWAVVGGGPAGMKAAETLAKRGHEVTLFEREHLGGQVNLILRAPHRESFGWITRDLEAQMRKAGVTIELGVEADRSIIEGLAPDGVVIATGALPDRKGFTTVLPQSHGVSGADQAHVVTGWDILHDPDRAGSRVVVLDSEGARGTVGVCEVLLGQGKAVEVVTRFNSLFPGTAPTLDMPIIYKRLFKTDLTWRLNSWLTRIDTQSVNVMNLYTGETEVVEDVDTVVFCTGAHAAADLYFELKDVLPEVHRIGDCLAPRRLDHAIYEGYMAGRELWNMKDRAITEGSLESWEEESVPVG